MNDPPQIRPRTVTICRRRRIGHPGHIRQAGTSGPCVRPGGSTEFSSGARERRNTALDIDANEKVLGRSSTGDRDADSGGGTPSWRECTDASALRGGWPDRAAPEFERLSKLRRVGDRAGRVGERPHRRGLLDPRASQSPDRACRRPARRARELLRSDAGEARSDRSGDRGAAQAAARLVASSGRTGWRSQQHQNIRTWR